MVNQFDSSILSYSSYTKLSWLSKQVPKHRKSNDFALCTFHVIDVI
jgi:hypothetical protein